MIQLEQYLTFARVDAKGNVSLAYDDILTILDAMDDDHCNSRELSRDCEVVFYTVKNKDFCRIVVETVISLLLLLKRNHLWGVTVKMYLVDGIYCIPSPRFR